MHLPWRNKLMSELPGRADILCPSRYGRVVPSGGEHAAVQQFLLWVPAPER